MKNKEMKNVIIGLANTSVNKIKNFLKKHNKLFLLYNKNLTPKQCINKHLVFNNNSQLCKAFENNLIHKTPILFETITTLNNMILNDNIIILDADFKPDGLVFFKPISVSEFLDILSIPWEKSPKKSSLCRYENRSINQYGNKAEITDILNNILLTLPHFAHLPFIIAFSQGINTNFKSFDEFIKDNRIVNKDNKRHFRSLDDLLGKVSKYFDYIVSDNKKQLAQKSKKMNSMRVSNIRRLCYYKSKYQGYNLRDFLDVEDNINLHY